MSGIVAIPPEQRRQHDVVDPHVHGRWLSDVILGAQDGLVNTLGVVLGVAAASGSAHVTFAAGIATAGAEAISMGGVAYTSSTARGELYRAERAREYRHVDQTPLVERDEVRTLYAKKGFSGALLDEVVETICANRDVWVAVMMAEEHALTPIGRRDSLQSAAIVGGSSAMGSLVPVVPFALLAQIPAAAAALALGALSLFVLGAAAGRMTTGRPAKSGAQLTIIGLIGAAIGYIIGWVAGVAP